MKATSNSDSVSMEFVGPVPAIVGPTSGHHMVVWVQASGGAGFTRPSQEERDYYVEMGKPVPEWQCEYFEFDGISWPEAALTIEFWSGSAKLRSLCLPGQKGRREEQLSVELPELKGFLHDNRVSPATFAASFHESLLRAAEAAGVIQRGVVHAAPRRFSALRVMLSKEPWWFGALRRGWARTLAAKAAKRQATEYSDLPIESHGTGVPHIALPLR